MIAVTFFAGGLPLLLGMRWATVELVRRSITRWPRPWSAMTITSPTKEDIADFYANNDTDALGLHVIGTSYLRRVDLVADSVAR